MRNQEIQQQQGSEQAGQECQEQWRAGVDKQGQQVPCEQPRANGEGDQSTEVVATVNRGNQVFTGDECQAESKEEE